MPPALGLHVQRGRTSARCQRRRAPGFHQPAVRAETGARVSGTHTSRRSHTYNTRRGQQQASETEHEKGCERAGVGDEPAEVLAEEPRHERQGQKHGCDQRQLFDAVVLANARLGLLSRDHGQGCLEDRCRDPCAATSSSTSRRWSWTSRRYGTSALSTSTNDPRSSVSSGASRDGRPDRVARLPAQ